MFIPREAELEIKALSEIKLSRLFESLEIYLIILIKASYGSLATNLGFLI